MSNTDNNKEVNQTTESLDSTQRVRVLSPGMLVAKRFFRNKLAIVGLVIIIAMFLFSFLGGAIMPYSESKVFFTTEVLKKDYAGATVIDDFHIYTKDGVKLPTDIRSKIIRANSSGEYIFETRDGSKFALDVYTEDSYGLGTVTQSGDKAALSSAEYAAAKEQGFNSFTYNGKTYTVQGDGIRAELYETENVAVVCKLAFTTYDENVTLGYDFYQQVLLAMKDNQTNITVDGTEYIINELDENAVDVTTSDGKEYAYVSNMNINAIMAGIFLTPEYKVALQEAIESGAESFEFKNAEGEMETYMLTNDNGQYTVKRYQETRVIDMYSAPSKEHPLGTDANGMDLLTRLMYGGRISLLIGFVVVAIEVVLGVIVGGIAGYFGGWIDNLLMRVVDVFYCIPVMPLYMILGSVMDHYKVSSTGRIYLLCVIMAVLGWVGIARIVRGQILSLREQEFMVATEATGISIGRRIFKHLVPNVIPQLIVYATMGLGSIILTEASLSFLGLGIKYPAATWGSIINAVNDSYVMTNYLFVWVPAGMLILLTVLAFNFIGDGLRDAFDPKMKR